MSCKNLTRYVVCGQLKSAMHELSAGAYADWRDPSDYDRTPLMYCAKFGAKASVKWLCEVANCNINLKDKFGKTARDYAVESYKQHIVEFLDDWPHELERRARQAEIDLHNQHMHRKIALERRENSRKAVKYLEYLVSLEKRSIGSKYITEEKLIDIFNALEAYPVPGASPTSHANFVDLARRLRPKLSSSIWTAQVWKQFQKASAAFSTSYYKQWDKTPTLHERLKLRYQ